MSKQHTQPRESVLDPFKLARHLAPQFPLAFAAGHWNDHGGSTVTLDHARAVVARQLKAVFDGNRLVDANGRVHWVTAQLVESVLLALAAQQVQS